MATDRGLYHKETNKVGSQLFIEKLQLSHGLLGLLGQRSLGHGAQFDMHKESKTSVLQITHLLLG